MAAVQYELERAQGQAVPIGSRQLHRGLPQQGKVKTPLLLDKRHVKTSDVSAKHPSNSREKSNRPHSCGRSFRQK